eukprot:TRINITY_DN247_c0_g1_i3.p1 TRINITY_DN247_c0_g1~~TRINITY_DN247_c0_g1_i3.p1  ORF type:complete len:448 (+),score=83.42 TRINITY_DN247_c0_g1_i3:2246-3589(+)
MKDEIKSIKDTSASYVSRITHVEEECNEIKVSHANAVSTAFMKLDKDFAAFEKKADESQEKCEQQVFSLKEELAHSHTQMERGINEWSGHVKQAMDTLSTIQKGFISTQENLEELNEKVKTLEEAQAAFKYEQVCEDLRQEMNTKFTQISDESKATLSEISKFTGQSEAQAKRQGELDSALKHIKLDLSEKITAVDKAILDLCGSKKIEGLQKNVEGLRNAFVKVNNKLNTLSKEYQALKQELNDKIAVKNEPTDQTAVKKAAELDTTLRELEGYKQKVGALQKRMRELDLATSEANRVNKLNIDNLALQVKNLELSRSLLKLEKFGPSGEVATKPKTPNRNSRLGEKRASACVNAREGFIWKTSDKENVNQSFSIKSETSEKSEIGVNTDENERGKEGRRMVVKLLKKAKLKIPAKVGSEQVTPGKELVELKDEAMLHPMASYTNL